MSAKHLFAGILLTVAAGATPVIAQSVPPSSNGPQSLPYLPSTSGPPSSAITNPSTMPQPVSPSANEWLNSPCFCNGPTGKNGPIGSEFFVLSGPTIATGPSIQAKFANVGWMVESGARTLLFNTSNDAAWTAVLALAYQYNDGSGRPPPFAFFGNANIPVTIRDIHRYGLTFGGGRDWFMCGQFPNLGSGTSLRVGLETGGRWGYEHVNLNLIINDPSGQNSFLEKSKVYGGYYIGAHADLEVPMGSWVWVCGLRAEWGINWGTVIPLQNNNIQDINLLFSTGFRY
jgi:hypothetical protein